MVRTRDRGGARVRLHEVILAIQNWDKNKEFSIQYFSQNGKEYVVLKSMVDEGNGVVAGWHVGQAEKVGQAIQFQKEIEMGCFVTVNDFVQLRSRYLHQARRKRL